MKNIIKIGLLFLMLGTFAYADDIPKPDGDGLKATYCNEKNLGGYCYTQKDSTVDKTFNINKGESGSVKWEGYIYLHREGYTLRPNLKYGATCEHYLNGKLVRPGNTIKYKIGSYIPIKLVCNYQKSTGWISYNPEIHYEWSWHGSKWMTVPQVNLYTKAPAPKITVPKKITVTEGKEVQIQLMFSNKTDEEIRVSYRTKQDSAKSPEDFTAKGETVIIPAGSADYTITIHTFDDSQEEPTEKFFVDFSKPVNAEFESTTRTEVFIRDNDGNNANSGDTWGEEDGEAIEDSSPDVEKHDDSTYGFHSSQRYRRDFILRKGGAGWSVYGDLTATGESILCEKKRDGSCNWNSSKSVEDAYVKALNEGGEGFSKNSSSAKLKMPALENGSNIVYARLYWQGMYVKYSSMHKRYGGYVDKETLEQLKSDIKGWTKIKFKTPDGQVHELQAKKDDVFWDATWGTTGRFMYQASVEVTNELKKYINSSSYKALGNKKYLKFSAGDILATTEGSECVEKRKCGAGAGYWSKLANGFSRARIGHYGGWSLVVVYDMKKKPVPNPDNIKYKNFALYDGYTLVNPKLQNGATDEIEIKVGGFLTPLSLPEGKKIDASLTFFAGRAKGKTHPAKGYFKLRDKEGNFHEVYDGNGDANSINPKDNPVNGTFTYRGDHINPKRIIHTGLNLNVFDASDYMSTGQTETTIKLGGTGKTIGMDSYAYDFTPSMVAFTVELYDPTLCYDYAYSQNGIFFTEPNIGNKAPFIKGLVNKDVPIKVSLYVRNINEADVFMSDIRLDIYDINHTQAYYESNSTWVTRKREGKLTHIEDEHLNISKVPNYLNNIKLGSIDNGDNAYAYYSLDVNSTEQFSKIDMPIKARVRYKIKLQDEDQAKPKVYVKQLDGKDVQICKEDNVVYDPIWADFNVVTEGVYKSSDNHPKFNIPTQVVGKMNEDKNFLITSHSELPEVRGIPFIRETEVPTIVGVEVLDASGFHDTKANCDQISQRITQRFWVPMFDGTTNVSQKNFGEALKTYMKEVEEIRDYKLKDYMKRASKGAAFRVISNLVDDDRNFMNIEADGLGKYKIKNYDAYLKWLLTVAKDPMTNDLYQSSDDLPCKSSVYKKVGSKNVKLELVKEACGDRMDSNGFMTLKDISKCNECLVGYSSMNVCSRDNFVIRPESYFATLIDTNQTAVQSHKLDTTNSRKFDYGRTGKKSPISTPVSIAAGYNYQYDIKAVAHGVDHEDDFGYKAVSGYSNDFYKEYFSPTYNEAIFRQNFPSDKNDTAVCNDLESDGYDKNGKKFIDDNLYFSEGTASGLTKIDNVGEYKLSLIDRTWAKFDFDADSMEHHKLAIIAGKNGKQPVHYFFTGESRTPVPDCEVGSSDVPETNANFNLVGNKINNLNGCVISNVNHRDKDSHIIYKANPYLVHPYKFDANFIQSFWVDNRTTFVTKADKNGNDAQKAMYAAQAHDGWIYTADINSTTEERNESVHFRGDITPLGADGSSLSNFVANCYATDLNLTLESNHSFGVGAPDRVYQVVFENNKVTPVYKDISVKSASQDENIIDLDLKKHFFYKDLNGTAIGGINFNFKRAVDTPTNPIRMHFKDLNATCKDETECTMQANFKSDHIPRANTVYDNNLTFIYGRVWTQDWEGASPIQNANVRFEVFCQAPGCLNANYSPAVPPLPGMPRLGTVNNINTDWFLNTAHVKIDGNITEQPTVNDGIVNDPILGRLDKDTGVTRAATPNVADGIESDITFTADGNEAYEDVLDINASSWLIYDRADPNADVTRFRVRFLSDGNGNWAGEGALGSVIADTNSSTKRRRNKMEW